MPSVWQRLTRSNDSNVSAGMVDCDHPGESKVFGLQRRINRHSLKIMSSTNPFSFQSGELVAHFDRVFAVRQTGYWHLRLEPTSQAPAREWYLACNMGRIAYSGERPLDWDTFARTLRNFSPELHDAAKQKAFQEFERHATEQQRNFLSLTLKRMAASNILGTAQVEQALQLATLADLDVFLFDRTGRAEFIEDYQLVTRCPIAGFEWSALKKTAQQRRTQWQQLAPHIPSLAAVPTLNTVEIARRSLSDAQQQQLQRLTARGESLQNIARRLAADPLKVAVTFGPLVQQGLVTLSHQTSGSTAVSAARTANPAEPASQVSVSASARSTPAAQSAPAARSTPAVRPAPAPTPRVTLQPVSSTGRVEPGDTRRSLGKSEVFVVDDSPLILRQFQTLVSSLGYQPVTCDDALAAVKTMLNHHPVAIFLDINMPGASGFELIKQIRRQPQLAQVPVVIMTAEQSQSNQKRAQWAKCTFLEKPLSAADISSFCSRLQDILRQIAPQPVSAPSRL